MLLSCVSALPFSALALEVETVGELTLNETVEFNPETNTKKFYYYSFVPEESGSYYVTTVDVSHMLLAAVYDENLNPVDDSLYRLFKGWTAFDTRTLCVDGLEKGRTYYVGIYLSGWLSPMPQSRSTVCVTSHTHSFVNGFCEECGLQDKNAPAGTFAVQDGVEISGKFVHYPKEHSYTLEVEEDSDYRITRSGLVPTVKDEDGNTVNNNYGMNSSAYYSLKGGKTYTVNVAVQSTYSPDYSFTVEKHEHDYINGYCTECYKKDESYVAPIIPLTLDTPYESEFFSTAERHQYTVTTDEAGYYAFQFTGTNTAITLTDATGNIISYTLYKKSRIYKLEADSLYNATVVAATQAGAYSVELIKHQHTLDIYSNKAATCKAEGSIERRCTTNCGYSETETLPVDPDAHQFVNGACRLCGAKDESYQVVYSEIPLNETVTAEAVYGGEMCYYTFTPEISGKYEIYMAQHNLLGRSRFVIYDETGVRLMNYNNRYGATAYRDFEAGKQYRIIVTVDVAGKQLFSVKAHSHDYNYKTESEPATCNERGYTKNICRCSEFLVQYTEATGNHSFKETVYAPTCTENGYTEYCCTVCGTGYYMNYVPANPNAHHFVNGICDECGEAKPGYEFTDLKYNKSVSFTLKDEDEERYFRYIPAESGYYNIASTGRADPYAELYDGNMNDITVADDISDSNYNFRLSAYFEEGKTYYLLVGIYDGVNKNITLKVTAHTHKYETETIAPTCGSMGATIKSCECGDYEITDVKEATGNHNYRFEETVAPTCIDKGFDVYTCTVCGDSYRDNEKEPTGIHDYAEKVCVNCGARRRGENKVLEAPIYVGDSISVSFTSLDDIACFTFIPESSGSYTFETTGCADTYAELTGSDGKLLASDDDSALAVNARINASFIKGREYIFTVDVSDLKECTFTVKLYEHTHSFVSFTEPATCAYEGSTEYTCTECFYKTTVTTPPTGIHKYVDGICEVCGDIDTSYSFEPFNEGEIKIVSTDIKVYSFNPLHSGEGVIKLNGLGIAIILDKNAEPIAPADENLKALESVKASFKSGEKYYIMLCPVLGSAVKAELNTDFEHTFDDYILPSNCVEKGYSCKKCTVCGLEKEKTAFTELGDHEYRVTKSRPATCTVFGYIKYACIYCNKSYIDTLDATGHSYVSSKAEPATFKKAGKTEGTYCKNCGEILIKQYTVDKLGSPKLSKLRKGRKRLTAFWNSVYGVDGYQLQYSLKKNMKKSKKKTVKNPNKIKLTVKKLKSGKKYYVRIRAYKIINGKRVYSKWSPKKTIKTK